MTSLMPQFQQAVADSGNRLRLALLLTMSLMLTQCGQKGGLSRPEPPPPPQEQPASPR